MRSTKFLDELAGENGLKNDNQIALFMGWKSGTVTNYRKGRRVMDNEACLAVALKLGIDPLRVIMAADIDRAERAGQHSLWEVFSKRTATAASFALIMSVNLFLTPQNEEAAPRLALDSNEATRSLYYVKLLKKLRAIMAGFKRLFCGTALQPAAA